MHIIREFLSLYNTFVFILVIMMTGARHVHICLFTLCILSYTCYWAANSLHYVSADESTNTAAKSLGSSAAEFWMYNDVTHDNQRQNLPSCTYTTSCGAQGEQVEGSDGSPKHVQGVRVKVAFGRRILGIRKGIVDGSQNLQGTKSRSELTDGRRKLRAGRVLSTKALYQPIDSRRGTLEAQSTSGGGEVEADGGRFGSIHDVQTQGVRHNAIPSNDGDIKTQEAQFLKVTDDEVTTEGSQEEFLDGNVDIEGHRFEAVISESHDIDVPAAAQASRSRSSDGGIQVYHEEKRYKNINRSKNDVEKEESHEGLRDGVQTQGVRNAYNAKHSNQFVSQDDVVHAQDNRYLGIHILGNRYLVVTQNPRVEGRSRSLDDGVHPEGRVVAERDQSGSLDCSVGAQRDQSGSSDDGVHTLDGQNEGVTQVEDRLDKEGNRCGSRDGGYKTEGNRFGTVSSEGRSSGTPEDRQASLDRPVDGEGNRSGSLDDIAEGDASAMLDAGVGAEENGIGSPTSPTGVSAERSRSGLGDDPQEGRELLTESGEVRHDTTSDISGSGELLAKKFASPDNQNFTGVTIDDQIKEFLPGNRSVSPDEHQYRNFSDRRGLQESSCDRSTDEEERQTVDRGGKPKASPSTSTESIRMSTQAKPIHRRLRMLSSQQQDNTETELNA